MLSMQGKNVVIFGVANKRSIAWAIAQRLNDAGAKLAITYQNERLKSEAHDLITSLPGAKAFQCDVSSDAEIDAFYAELKQHFGQLDAVVHSVAYAPADAMHGDFLNTSREAFRIAHDVSVYSLVAVTRAAAPLMTNGGSVITLTYFGAEKVVPGYNVMGVAKAASGSDSPLPCQQPGREEDSGERHLRRPDQDAGSARRGRFQPDAQEPRRARATEKKC